MYKIFFFSILLMFTELSAQIKLSVQVLEGNRSELHLQFTVSNESPNNIILPIDTVGFKAYMSEDNCTDFYMIMNYPDLGLLPMVTDEEGTYLESMLDNKGKLSAGNFYFVKKAKKYEKDRNTTLNGWKKKFNIYNKDKNWININYYLFNHLTLLKPYQKISFKKKLDFSKINESPDVYSYNYYPLQENFNYEIFFKICIDESIYQYLTKEQKEQKEQFKDYAFFKGKIESNKMELK